MKYVVFMQRSIQTTDIIYTYLKKKSIIYADLGWLTDSLLSCIFAVISEDFSQQKEIAWSNTVAFSIFSAQRLLRTLKIQIMS